MIFEIEKDVWFDSEKLYIIKGKDNYEKFNEKYEEYTYPARTQKKREYPVITFLSTTCCNLKCTYCYAGQGTYNNVSKENSFSYENYIKAYECTMTEYGGVKGICFFGGEPLLNFIEIKKFVQYLYNEKPHLELPFISIGSNGTIMNEEIIDFISEYNIAFGTSLDGVKKYNDLCRVGDNVSSVYDEVVKTLYTLGNKKVLTSLQFTFNKVHLENYKKGDVVKWVEEFEKLPISFYEIIAATTENEFNHVDLKDKEILESYEMLCNDLAEYSLKCLANGKTTIMSVIFAFIIVSIGKRRVAGHCGAGKNITIAPDLRVYPCHVVASDINNGVKCEPGFRKAINSNEKFQDMIALDRNNVDKCQGCIAKNLCSVFCKGMCSAKPVNPPEERCLMMRIFVERTISFMVNDYPNCKDTVMTSIRKVLKAHGVIL